MRSASAHAIQCQSLCGYVHTDCKQRIPVLLAVMQKHEGEQPALERKHCAGISAQASLRKTPLGAMYQ
jgi:hypothetical protein